MVMKITMEVYYFAVCDVFWNAL